MQESQVSKVTHIGLQGGEFRSAKLFFEEELAAKWLKGGPRGYKASKRQLFRVSVTAIEVVSPKPIPLLQDKNPF